MSTNTILLLLLSLIVAAGIAFYQYLYKANNKSKLYLFLAFLRFATIFLILILLINPIISKKTYEITKTPLPIVVDNSASISFMQQDKIAKELVKRIANNQKLQEKYAVSVFHFDKDFYSDSLLDFKGKQSNIKGVFDNVKQLYRSEKHPVVVLTDGNPTQGNDYVYGVSPNITAFPIVLGDTLEHLDLRISQLNANKYAFLKNKFPVEVFLNYNGDKPVNASFSIFNGTSKVFQQTVTFSASQKFQNIAALLPANKIGVQTYRAEITSPLQEKNKYNNSKNFAVEVIDERTEVALVSAIVHPDLGALKKAIESNEQRKVTIVKPQNIGDLGKYTVFILYQPDASFKTVFEGIEKTKANSWIITGLNTDYTFLNQMQRSFDFKMLRQKEDYTATLNENFNSFSTDAIGYEQFPPLENPFGTITAKQNTSNLLLAKIRNVTTDNPLLTFVENGSNRNAFLFGENIWKWRMETYLQEKSFVKFDIFTNKIIQYLATNTKKKNLIVNHESFYNSGETITITAEYFNKNYELDSNAQLSIQLKNNSTSSTKIYDFTKGFSDYKVDFQDVESGDYSFVVTEKNSNAKYVGSFKVLDFEVEKQFVNADWSRLQQLAENTHGKAYTPKQVDTLIDFLIKNETYKNIQKEIVQKTPLIDWIWGLILLAALLTTEWFVRKYNGLL